MREFFEGSKGRVVAGGLVVLAIAAAACSIYANGHGASGGANDRTFIDAKTGETFEYDLVIGDKLPVRSPSGRAGYPAEACYWTKDGKIKDSPTFVLLNQSVGKPGPTFCPDCGRLVSAHNLAPTPGGKAPPTQAEYAARRGAADAAPPATER